MNKIFFKVLITMVLIISCCVSYVFATDIDMNLTGNSEAIQTNQLEDTNVEDDVNSDVEDIDDLLYDNFSETLQSSSVSSSSDTELGLSNIINILLITVGIILILLAIAILIRLKN